MTDGGAGCAGCRKCDVGRGKGVGPGPTILLVGNPNAGKTTLFNALSGSRARVGNYPGITVERRSAALPLPSGAVAALVDLPGTYSLTARSPEEQVAVDAVLDPDHCDVVVVVADATTLRRGLYLVLQIIEAGVPTVLALNMMDDARRAGIDIDVAQLQRQLGIPVVPTVASRGEGLLALKEAVERAKAPPAVELPLPPPALVDIAEMQARLPPADPGRRRCRAIWALLSLGQDELVDIPVELRAASRRIRERAAASGRDLDLEIIGARYAVVDEITGAVLRPPQGPPRRTFTARLDSVLTHRVLGSLVFAAVMFLVFEALFSWAEPAMGLVESAIGAAQGLVTAHMGEGMLRDLFVDGVIQGVGNVLVFVPQIALLFAFIVVLEDSGYLARVAFIIDPIMARLGLHGRAFVPLLSGFACAVPAILATRTIENRRHRLITMMALPFMSCSARLPVYVLVIATVFAGQPRIGGVVSVGAAALFAMYLLSVAATLGVAALLGRTVFAGPRPALVLELPTYRVPSLRSVLRATGSRVMGFIREAGTVILGLTIVLWALLSLPHGETIEAEYAQRAETVQASVGGEERDEALAQLRREESTAQLKNSVAGRVAVTVEPALEPLGMDWRIGVAVFGSFAAREVFVSTLGVVFSVEDADESSVPLREALRSAKKPDGAPLMTPLSGVALMVFFVLACQCMSTLAVVRRESGSWRYPVFMFAYMSALAYGCTLLVYQAGTALGWGGP